MGNDIRKLLKAAEAQGFTVERTAKSHWRVRNADGQIVAVIAGTPSDRRSWLNTIADMRRAGFRWPPRR